MAAFGKNQKADVNIDVDLDELRTLIERLDTLAKNLDKAASSAKEAARELDRASAKLMLAKRQPNSRR